VFLAVSCKPAKKYVAGFAQKRLRPVMEAFSKGVEKGLQKEAKTTVLRVFFTLLCYSLSRTYYYY